MTGRARPRAHTRADVARRAGTSTAVVSYVLNGGPRPVAPATRARVEKAIEELNYRPDRIARALAARRTETLGLVVPDITNPFMSDVARAVEAAASARGYTVLLANSAIDQKREQAHIEHLIDRRVDGILLASVGLEPAFAEEINRSGVPVVVLDRRVDGLDGATVTVDNAGGALEAASHLIGHGHRRVACITGPPALRPTAERRKGWAEAVAGHGLARRACPVVTARIDRRAGYDAAIRLIRRPRPPTAVFVATDEQAFGVLRAAADLGLVVPDDLAVASFDGIAQAAYAVPGLTTMAQPVDNMAGRAVDLVLSGAAGDEVLAVQLVRRGSCGCPDLLDDRGPGHPSRTDRTGRLEYR